MTTQYRRKVINAFLVGAVLVLAGCDGPEVGGAVQVDGNGGGITDYHMQTWLSWNFNLHSKDPSLMSTSEFDAAFASVDFSSSSVALASSSGTAFVTLTLEDDTEVSNSFNWVAQNEQLFAESPSTVNNWVSSYEGEIVGATINLSGQITNPDGVNTLSGEAYYDGVEEASFSTTWTKSGSCDSSDVTCIDP